MRKRKRNRAITCYLILSTQLIGLVVFNFYPMIWAGVKAFQYYTGLPSDTRWIGIDNFVNLFVRDKTYWNLWLRTIIFAGVKLCLEIPLSLLCAVFLSRKVKFAGFFRAMYYLPCVVAGAIVGLILSCMFDYFGLINAWLVQLGLIDKPIDWFANTLTSWAVIIIGYTWNTFGTNVLYFMAALSNIPKELLESARLDGANGWQVFIKVKVPLMGPVLQTILLLALNGTLHCSDFIIVTTNGAPYGTTHTVMSYQISKFLPGFADTSSTLNIGYGCAMAIVTSVFMTFIALIYSRMSQRLQNIY